MSELSRFVSTVKYLKPSQVWQRIKNRTKLKFVKQVAYQKKAYVDASRLVFLRNPVRENYPKELFEAPSTFTFLNLTIDVKESWFPDSANHLWLYNLHYFDYLFDISEESTYWRLINSWLENVPTMAKSAWHPYTTSLRICNWIFSYSARYADSSTKGIDSSCTQSFLNSLTNQTRFVEDFLELDVLGNHLVENCKALIVSGAFFRNDGWLNKGSVLLKKQLEEQLLPDGGHYERSPMYHCIVLEDLLQIKNVLDTVGKKSAEVDEYIIKMALFLAQILEADSSIPLLNDSAYKICVEPDVLLAEVKRLFINIQFPDFEKRLCLQDFGVFLVRSDKLSLTFDIGQSCPDFLPAHAHSDILSYDLWLNGTPVVSDSGTYEYTNGQWRTLFRETASHSTVKIDNVDLIETWSSFRVGRRGGPKEVVCSKDGQKIKCVIDNFDFLGVAVSRTIQVADGEAGIIVNDEFCARKGEHTYTSYIQLHPGVKIGQIDDSATIVRVEFLCKGGLTGYLLFPQEILFETDLSWYSEEFGKKVQRVRVIFKKDFSAGRHSFLYAIIIAKCTAELIETVSKVITHG